jgi:hypothetical protein
MNDASRLPIVCSDACGFGNGFTEYLSRRYAVRAAPVVRLCSTPGCGNVAPKGQRRCWHCINTERRQPLTKQGDKM